MCTHTHTHTHIPYDGGEVAPYLGLDERLVERGVRPGDHQRRQQAEGETLECVGDAGERKRECDPTRTRKRERHRERDRDRERERERGRGGVSYSPSR